MLNVNNLIILYHLSISPYQRYTNYSRTSTMGNTNGAVIKENQIPYNYITCKEAQELLTRLSTGEKQVV